jgi:hypothetical protein
VTGDLLAVLHGPYTLWHLSYVAIGAGLAASVDWLVLAGTLLAFFFGTGIAAHAFDELHTRPLHTGLPDIALRALGIGGFTVAAAIAVVGAFVLTPWVLAWAAIGITLAAGYAVEQPRLLHTPLGFALAWGAFPVLVGYWAQSLLLDGIALAAAAFATMTSLVQRSLSTSARNVRRTVDRAELNLHRGDSIETWDETMVLASWERSLRVLAWAMPSLALALLLSHLD